MIINNAESVNDLQIPPASYLEKLEDNFFCKYSVRINDQYRICFKVENI